MKIKTEKKRDAAPLDQNHCQSLQGHPLSIQKSHADFPVNAPLPNTELKSISQQNVIIMAQPHRHIRVKHSIMIL